ncbi:hypothetical protein KKA53_01340 [Candidatus Dependentiae bacterium]|nr:hypothetical protein [Candidatus Dependentiae bacterium]
MSLFYRTTLFFFLIAGFAGSLTCELFALERTSRKRFEQVFVDYAKQQKIKKIKRFGGCLMLGAGVAGGVGLGAWALFCDTGAKTSSETAKVVENPAPSGSFRAAIKAIAMYSVAGFLVSRLGEFFQDGCSYVKKFFTGCPDKAKNALMPYAQRLNVELGRLEGAVKFLRNGGDNPIVKDFYKREVVSAFGIVVRSLEKFSAILHWHMQAGSELSYSSNIDVLFLFCNRVAGSLEERLNHDDVSQTTCGGVATLRQAIMFFVGNVA